MDLSAVLNQVQGLIGQHADNQRATGFNPAPLLNEVEQLFSRHTAVPQTQADPSGLVDNVKRLIEHHADNQSGTGFDASPLLNDIEGLFRQQG